MKKITIELKPNELMAIEHLKLAVGYLEHSYFWAGLLVHHNVLPLYIDLDNIKIEGNIAEIHYEPKNKSDLV